MKKDYIENVDNKTKDETFDMRKNQINKSLQEEEVTEPETVDSFVDDISDNRNDEKDIIAEIIESKEESEDNDEYDDTIVKNESKDFLNPNNQDTIEDENNNQTPIIENKGFEEPIEIENEEGSEIEVSPDKVDKLKEVLDSIDEKYSENDDDEFKVPTSNKQYLDSQESIDAIDSEDDEPEKSSEKEASEDIELEKSSEDEDFVDETTTSEEIIVEEEIQETNFDEETTEEEDEMLSLLEVVDEEINQQKLSSEIVPPKYSNDTVEEPSNNDGENTASEDKKDVQKDKGAKKSLFSKKDKPKKEKPPKKPKKTKGDSPNKGKFLKMGLIFLLILSIGVLIVTASNLLNKKGIEKPVEDTPIENTETIVEEETNVDETPTEPEEKPEIKPEVKEEPKIELFDSIEGTLRQKATSKAVIEIDGNQAMFELTDSTKISIDSIIVGDKIVFDYKLEGNKKTITSIESTTKEDVVENQEDEKTVESDTEKESEETESEEVVEEVDELTSIFGDKYADQISKINKDKESEVEEVVEEDQYGLEIETAKFDMDIGGSGTLWFRFGWRPTETTKEVPSVDDVVVELRNPNGTLINEENIDKFGKRWTVGNSVHYVIKKGYKGKWSFVVTKNNLQSLGEVDALVTPLTGYMTVKSSDVAFHDGRIHAIWEVSGVRDQALAVDILAKSGSKEILLYSGNTADNDLKLVDTVSVSTKKLVAGTYDIILKIQDIDIVTVDGVSIIDTKTITETMIFENIEVTK